MEPVALRPLSFGEILDTSFNLFKRNFKSAVIVSAVIMVPLTLLGAAASAGLAPSDLAALDNPDASVEEVLSLMSGLFGAVGVGSLLQIVGSVLVQAATTRIYSENYRGLRMEPGDALRYGLRRLPAMVALTIVSTIGLGIGALLCLLPGIWLYAAWGLAPAALIAEDDGPIESLRRSFQLVKGAWWRVFGVLLVAALLVAVITSIVTTPIQLAVTFGSGFADAPTSAFGSFLALNTLISGLATALTLPFSAAVVVALFFDQKVRKEGYDLQRLITDLGAPPEGITPPPADPGDPFGLG